MQVDLFTVAAAIIAVVVVVLLVRYLRTHPEAKARVDAEFTSIEGKVEDAYHTIATRLADVVGKQHDTIAAQAAVIASPPVQAAINATPAPAAKPAPIPSAANTSAPATPLADATLSLSGSSATAVPGSTPTAGPRIEAIMATGASDTVTLPVTGHVLSLPVAGESYMMYCQRVAVQAHGNAALVGMLFLATAPAGDPSGWPAAADQFFNATAYMTPEQLAAHNATQAQWAALTPGH